MMIVCLKLLAAAPILNDKQLIQIDYLPSKNEKSKN